MKKIKSYSMLIAVIAVMVTVSTILLQIDMGSYSITSVHREIKQIDHTTQVIQDDPIHLSCSTKTEALQPLTARFLLEKVSFHIKGRNNNLIFHSFFAILFKVARVPSNLSRMLLAVIVYQLSASGRIITLLHLADGRKKASFFF